jgi:Leucine-rich repeat (LRR) protein
MDFDIINYLNSLPQDIECIDLRNNNLTFIPSLERFKNLKELNCSFNKLTSLPSLNENLRELNCSYNQLTSLPSLNENLQILNCLSNHLTSLPSLNKNLQQLHCYNNDLTSLPSLNENLEILYCSYNQLTSLPSLNENLQKLDFNNNPICEIIGEIIEIGRNTIDICKKQIQTFNNFRNLYWCLKFKKQLKKWLWEKIREPKIMKEYHPSYLFSNLREDTDLYKFLNNL